MGFFSKVFKGLKKVVKKVAKGIKKVAKGVTTSLPGGQKLWKKTGELGKKAMKAIGKMGPLAIVAIQVLLSVTGVGAAAAAALGSMWSGLGAVAASAAANGGLIASTLGNIGTAIFNAGNFIGGTLGAMGNAITEGGSKLLSGNLAGASEAFMSNMTSALSGEAGMTAMNAAAAQAANAASTSLGSLNAEQAVVNGVDPNFAAENLAGEATGASSVIDPNAPFEAMDLSLGTPEELAASAAEQATGGGAKGLTEIAENELYGKAGNLSLKETGTLIDYGKEGVKAIQPGAANATAATDEKLGDKVESFAKDQVNKFLTPEKTSDTAQRSSPYQAQRIRGSKVTTGGGSGSEGFSLLSGVRGLEQSVRNSQSLMFS